jgi:hypothetical protein
MTVTVKHPFVSTVPDSADTSLVRPSNWNADHTIVGLGTAAELNAGVANGVATLDGGGTVPLSQIPASIQGTLSYQGTWNASTNTPTLASGVGTKGYYYVVSVAGSTNLDGITDWNVGDMAVYSGTAWQQIDNTDAVTSVNGYTGTVVLNATDVGALATITSSDGSIDVSTVGTAVDLTVSINSPASTLIGQVRNETGATLTRGTVVYISGAAGNKALVSKALATSDATSAQTYGVITADISNNQNGYATIAGSLGNLNTSAYTDGTQLYLSSTTAGTWTSTKQYAPNHLVYVGVVTRSHVNQGTIEVKIQNGYEMDELHNVSAQTPSNGNVLIWNNSTQLWESAGITAGTGISVTNGAGSITVANTGVTSVSGTAPVVSSGGATPTISMAAASASANGYLTSTDWSTFNSKQPAGTYVTSVGATSPITSTGGTTPTLAMPAATSSVNGYLTSTDWTTFNNKGSGSVTSVAASVPSFLSVSGSPITSSGTLAITYSGTALPIANGGTGATTRQNAMDALAGAVTAGQYLRGNGTDVVMSAIQAADVPTLNQNTTGTAANVTGVVTAANGGTGLSAVGTTGNVLTSNGTAWVSSAPVSSNITARGLFENANTISANYTIGTNNNAISAGPITVASGVTVTVPSGSVWTIV